MKNSIADPNGSAVIYLRARGEGAAPKLARDEQLLRQRLSEAGIDHADAIVLRDVGSSRSPKRPAFRNLMELLEHDRIAVLATVSLCTLARDSRAFEVVQLLRECGAKLVLDHGLVPDKSMPIVTLMHQVFSEMLTSRLRRGRGRRGEQPRRRPTDLHR